MNKPYIILILILLVLSQKAVGQNFDYDANYDAARLELEKGNYQVAYNGFKNLLEVHPAHEKSPYASFYYGVAAYSLDDKKKSKDIFLQITRRNPSWEKLSEVFLWLSKLSFELDSPNQGMYYAKRIGDNNLAQYAYDLQHSYLSQYDQGTLASLLSEHDEDTLIAEMLAFRMSELQPMDRDIDSLTHLIQRYDLDSAIIGLGYPEDIFKEKYKVAVMLPLFVERLWHSGVYMQKSLAVDLYEGIQMAISEFDTSRISIKVFDTQKNSDVTSKIIQDGRLATIDAVIGPLYPGPIAQVSEYCYENELNFINPVSTNSELIRHNPYAFLLRTGSASMGNIIAEYTSDIIVNEAYAIYSGPRATDTLTAYNYREKIEADSFKLVISQKVQTSNARTIFDYLTTARQVVDSVELQRMYNNGEEVRFLPLKDSLLLPIDSLGHIFIASDNKAIASEVMAAITSRGDTTQLIGVGNWFSIPNAGLGLMESLGVWLAMQEFENMMLHENQVLSKKYRAIYFENPSKYFYYGYYAMKFLGESLLEYGVYFQNGFRINGNLNPMYDYKSSQDNRRLLLYTLEEGKPTVLNDQFKSGGNDEERE
ncbi:MAG: hypothetical protein ABFS32_00855 [Bacteroidota bacterium]